MPEIFNCLIRLRTFLADYAYCHHKAENPAFSYQLLSDKVGFSNRGFEFNVITGTKNLSPVERGKAFPGRYGSLPGKRIISIISFPLR